MSGKRAKARYRAHKEYVQSWVNYAFSSGDHTNPFEETDKRHLWFKRQLHHDLCVDHDFREMHLIMGGDLDELKLRQYPKPKFITLEEFNANY